jgi:hypothetical protein
VWACGRVGVWACGRVGVDGVDGVDGVGGVELGGGVVRCRFLVRLGGLGL